MVTQARIVVSGTTIAASDVERIRVRKSITHASDTFDASVFNTGGTRSGLFTIGTEVEVYHDIGSPVNNQIFLGRIESVDYDSNPNSERIHLRGRDYTSRLMDTRVQAVYTSGGVVSEIGSIVRDLIWTSNFSGTIGVTNVSGTTRVLSNIRFRNRSLYESIQELAEIAGYDFFINYSRDLVFRPENANATGYTLGSMNVVTARFETNSQEMFNRVTVYGDSQLVGHRESFTANGVGSIFTLNYKPHNTSVTVSGAIRQGGVFEMVSFSPSGTQYLVDFDRRQIIFTSGTAAGANLPGSLVEVIVNYDRKQPIIKEAIDDASVAAFGMKETVITNTEIKSPAQALDVARAELERTKNPLRQGFVQLSTDTMSGVQPGQTVVVHLPNDNLNNVQMKALETTYDINEENLRSNSVIGIRLGNRIHDMSDALKELVLKVRELQARDTDVSDIITRYRNVTGSFGLRTRWFVRTQEIGSAFILGHPRNGVLGVLGGGSVQPLLGDYRLAQVIVLSGGDFSTGA